MVETPYIYIFFYIYINYYLFSVYLKIFGYDRKWNVSVLVCVLKELLLLLLFIYFYLGLYIEGNK